MKYRNFSMLLLIPGCFFASISLVIQFFRELNCLFFSSSLIFTFSILEDGLFSYFTATWNHSFLCSQILHLQSCCVTSFLFKSYCNFKVSYSMMYAWVLCFLVDVCWVWLNIASFHSLIFLGCSFVWYFLEWLRGVWGISLYIKRWLFISLQKNSCSVREICFNIEEQILIS